MAAAQTHAGRGARAPQIVINDLAQGQAVLAVAAELGCLVQLRSAPDAVAYAGVGWLQALGEALGHELVIDCGDQPGHAMAALRLGCRQLGFSGPAATLRRLASMATPLGAWVEHEPTPPAACLQLTPGAEAGTICRAWLQRLGGAGASAGRVDPDAEGRHVP